MSNKKEDAIGIQWSKKMIEKIIVTLVLLILAPIQLAVAAVMLVATAVYAMMMLPVVVIFDEPFRESRRIAREKALRK